MGNPGRHRRRQGILAPARERIAGQGHHAGDVGAGCLEEVAGKTAVTGQQLPVEVEERTALVEMPGRLVAHVGHLRVEIIVIIALPRRQGARVGRPDSLQRHGRCPETRGSAIKQRTR